MLSYKHTGRLLVKGEIGCFCSHLLAWRALLADEHLTQMIVIEDDRLGGLAGDQADRQCRLEPTRCHIHEAVLEVPSEIQSEVLVVSNRK